MTTTQYFKSPFRMFTKKSFIYLNKTICLGSFFLSHLGFAHQVQRNWDKYLGNTYFGSYIQSMQEVELEGLQLNVNNDNRMDIKVLKKSMPLTRIAMFSGYQDTDAVEFQTDVYLFDYKIYTKYGEESDFKEQDDLQFMVDKTLNLISQVGPVNVSGEANVIAEINISGHLKQEEKTRRMDMQALAVVHFKTTANLMIGNLGLQGQLILAQHELKYESSPVDNKPCVQISLDQNLKGLDGKLNIVADDVFGNQVEHKLMDGVRYSKKQQILKDEVCEGNQS